MAVIAHVILHSVTPRQYDAVRAKAGWLEQPPDGGIAHLTWWDGAYPAHEVYLPQRAVIAPTAGTPGS